LRRDLGFPTTTVVFMAMYSRWEPANPRTGGHREPKNWREPENPKTGGNQRTQGLAGTREPEDWLGYLR